MDLLDLAAIDARQGADCVNDQPLPAASDQTAKLVVNAPTDSVAIGEEITVDITTIGLEPDSGFELALSFDPARLRFDGLTWHPALATGNKLGPTLAPASGQAHPRLPGSTLRPDLRPMPWRH